MINSMKCYRSLLGANHNGGTALGIKICLFVVLVFFFWYWLLCICIARDKAFEALVKGSKPI